MEVIKRGLSPQDKSADWLCQNCKSTIRAKMSEGRLAEGRLVVDQRFVILVCPVCNKESWISTVKFI